MNFHENTREFPRTNEAWIDAEGCLGWQNKGSAGWAYLPIGINQSARRVLLLKRALLLFYE